jgi:hypothetical protein
MLNSYLFPIQSTKDYYLLFLVLFQPCQAGNSRQRQEESCNEISQKIAGKIFSGEANDKTTKIEF